MPLRFRFPTLFPRAADPSDSATDSAALSSDEEPPRPRDTNDSHLREAIEYLNSEGVPDTLEEYRDNIRQIEDHILRQYVEEGYSYNRKLYRTLQRLVRSQQRKFAQAGTTMAQSSHNEGYRERRKSHDLSHDLGMHAGSSRDPRRSAPAESLPRPEEVPASLPKASLPEDDMKKQYRYGGPDNEAEEWHKNHPNDLSFGENQATQEWASLRIQLDLQQGAMRTPGQEDPIVRNQGSSSAVRYRAPEAHMYESGTKFTLPPRSEKFQAFIAEHPELMEVDDLAPVVNDFNRGGDEEEELVRKDYGPRAFLGKIAAPREQGSVAGPSTHHPLGPPMPPSASWGVMIPQAPTGAPMTSSAPWGGMATQAPTGAFTTSSAPWGGMAGQAPTGAYMDPSAALWGGMVTQPPVVPSMPQSAPWGGFASQPPTVPSQHPSTPWGGMTAQAPTVPSNAPSIAWGGMATQPHPGPMQADNPAHMNIAPAEALTPTAAGKRKQDEAAQGADQSKRTRTGQAARRARNVGYGNAGAGGYGRRR
jgi:hypothetical protein